MVIKVHNWWTLGASVLGVIVLYNILQRPQAAVSVGNAAGSFIDNTIKALEVPAK